MSSKFSPNDILQFTNLIYQGRPVTVVPYGYTVSVASLAQGASVTQSLNITANADFILTEIKARSGIGTAQNVSTKVAPYVRVLITDSGSNEQFTNSAVDLENYSTNGDSEAGGLPYMRFISGRTSLSITMTSYAPTAETYSIDLYLEGVLVRAFSGA